MSDPFTGYRFFVTLDATDVYLPPEQAATVPILTKAGFQEVGGLGGQLEVMAYGEGGVNDCTHQLPVRHSWSRITLKRGVTTDMSMWLWYQAGLYQSLGARRDGAITLLAENGTPAMQWLFRGGLAVKWDGPTFNAAQSAVAIESMEIAHEGILQVPLTTSR
ncbi:phage tail protein [Stieleria varia]|uniref:T4-like virus tail tube protein gp19 n=1 Tax=Stieleria varia TaxID=2528005 RepID=A0A5C5ZXM2_9BACT|nr:phage tail protein [Stieleria varia]TWT91738.1 T4-like virus tail tube protein gp19 [Stieleria varia]